MLTFSDLVACTTGNGNSRRVLITDRANARIIEVDVATKGIVGKCHYRRFPQRPQPAQPPKCAELLENGHIICCDENSCPPTPFA